MSSLPPVLILTFLFASGLRAQNLSVAAAADLAPLKQPLVKLYRESAGGSLAVTLGSSGMLAAQIRQGAPYDVYLSANEDLVIELAHGGFVSSTGLRTYATGRLGLWAARGPIPGITELAAARVRFLALPNPKHAPYGIAAVEALRSQGLWGRLEAKVVYAENVRQAFEFASTGNADAVITSWTLVFDKGGILLSETWHRPIRQAAGIVAASPRRQTALRFLDLLLSAEGQALLQRYGLFPPGSPLRP